MVRWTEEMLEELKITNSITEYAKKYFISYNTARNKRKELLGVETKVVDIVSEEKTEVLEVLQSSEISIIPSVILDIDSLIKNGVQFYLAEQSKELSMLEKAIIDIEHMLEFESDRMDSDKLATLGKNIGTLRRKRRLYKDEKNFLDVHRTDCSHFIKFIKDLKVYSEGACSRSYSTRVLKEELGTVLSVNENNSELISLRERVKELENNNSNSLSREIIDRLLSLEKFNIKQTRKMQREAGQKIALDKLENNWKDMFFKKLDEHTRNGILDDCRKMYKNVDIEEIREWEIMNDILPTRLVQLNYFVKKR